MNKTCKAEPRIIQLGEIPITVYQLPNGNYCLSQTEVTAVIEKLANSIFYYRRSKRVQALLCSNLELPSFYVEGANKPIASVPLELAALYWQHWDAKGNLVARALVNALIKRSLRDLADEVFEVKTTSVERNAQLIDDLSVESVDRLSKMSAYLETESKQPEMDKSFDRQLSLQVQQLMLQIQNLQNQLNQIQSQQPVQPTRYSTYIVVESSGAVNRETGVTHLQLREELGIEDVDELNTLMTEAGVDITSGYWHIAKAVTPILPLEHYHKVKALLLEHIKRRLEFQ